MAKQQDADGGAYRAAFASCRPTLELLMRASDESGRMAARAWWVVCMGKSLDNCRGDFQQWRAEAAEAALPQQLLERGLCAGLSPLSLRCLPVPAGEATTTVGYLHT